MTPSIGITIRAFISVGAIVLIGTATTGVILIIITTGILIGPMAGVTTTTGITPTTTILTTITILEDMSLEDIILVVEAGWATMWPVSDMATTALLVR